MTHLLMTTWDGWGTTPPLMSVARALVGARAQPARARRPGIETRRGGDGR